MKKSMPTMKDVAQEAGVALGTVSKVFNGIAVGESYRIKVEDAARKLGYEVNQYARGLRAGTTSTVALILPSVDHPFFSLLAQHVCAALLQRSYRMLLYVTAAQPEAERECLGMVRQNKVDGVIALTYNHLEVAEGLPFVSIDRCLGPNIPCVAADNYAGGRLAAEKLLELGCTHLAFLRVGSPNLSETDKRGDGFESLCRARQVPYEMLRLEDGAEDVQFREFFQAHMKDGRMEIDGIFCSTDLLACRIRAMLGDLELRVPEDVQIIGFDGVRQFGTGALYGSTIIQPVQKIAETSVELLLAKDRSHAPALVCLPVAYAHGGTTKE
nr:LacI family DNA-binding transcriptional regulator [uncultured Oscillibacter sp.]